VQANSFARTQRKQKITSRPLRIDEIAKLAILMALAAVGLNTSLQAMRQTGLKSFILGLCLALALAALSLSLILLTGVGN
jgi:uncharacterized membrane protein YadS